MHVFISYCLVVKLHSVPINKRDVSTLKLRPLKKKYCAWNYPIYRNSKSVNCACSMNASVVTENVQPTCMLHAYWRVHTRMLQMHCYTFLMVWHNFVQILKPYHSIAVLSAVFYKSRLGFISFQRRIYISFSQTKTGAVDWHLVLYHSVALEKRKKEGRTLNSILSLILYVFASRRFSPTFLSAIGNVSLKWHDPRRRDVVEGRNRSPLRRGAAGNKTFKSSGDEGEAYKRERTV